MTIKRKLFFNTLLTLAGIAIIGGVSLIGMTFVQGKLFVLTERSTPFQLKTIEMQRSLQEHTSNLLEVAFSASSADLKNARANAERTLADIQRVRGELDTLKGKGTDGTGSDNADRLDSLTRDMFTTTEQRLKAEESAKVADQSMRVKLQEITRKLSEMDVSIQRRQKSSAHQLSTSSGSARDITQRLMSLTSARDSIKDANFAFVELQKATGKKGVIIARGKLDAAMSEFSKNPLVGTKDPAIKVPAELVAEAKKLVTGPQGFLELKGALLSKGADAPTKEYDQVAQNVASKLSSAVIEVEQSIALATAKYNQENRHHDDSLKGSNAAGDILAQTGELISLGLDLKSIIRELFAARSTEELTRLSNELKGKLASAEGVQRRIAAAVAGSRQEAGVLRGVGGMLGELRSLLFARGETVDKLQQVITVRTQAAALNAKLKELVAQQNEQGKKGVTAAHDEQEKAVASVNRLVKGFVLAVSILGLGMMVFGLVTSLLLARSITAPIHDLTELAEGFGNGNFSGKMDAGRKDEFGALAVHFNQATTKLEEITGALSRAIRNLAEHSRELSTTAEELTHGAQEQTMATDQSAAAMTEMSQTIIEVAKSANEAATAAQQALETAGRGSEIVTYTAQGMEQIADSVRESTGLVQNLGERSEQVGSIIGIINDIADQTSLLALNASIEAARAGDMGMGFAVVADEVRKLATRTTEATSEIAKMIRDIQQETSRSIGAMKSGDSRVANGVRLAGEASRSLEEILEASHRGAEMAQRIAIAAEQQSATAEEISASVEEIARITHGSQQATQRIRHFSAELMQLAEELSGMAAWFAV